VAQVIGSAHQGDAASASVSAWRGERIRELRARYLTDLRTTRKTRLPNDDCDLDDAEPTAERSWKELLLEQLMRIAPDAFERLARRLLREADFDSVNVTGRSGDGGIDGLGVYRLGLVSFPVFFQWKRYRGSVSPSAVRDFRGAMAGRGDKGLLITTGTFTAEAKKEATRDGAPPIDLIDGDRLCDLLKRYDLERILATKCKVPGGISDVASRLLRRCRSRFAALGASCGTACSDAAKLGPLCGFNCYLYRRAGLREVLGAEHHALGAAAAPG
jgi:Restriction endonuclease